MARKAISKKIRFEVFKRDSFKCQYCGRSAPEVVLHVDHIKPVKENGENDIMNYITACQDCNLGKGARRLDDSSEIEKQKKELDILQERREQIEMMMQWREGLHSIMDQEVDAIDEEFRNKHHRRFNEKGRLEIKKLIKRFSFKEILDAIECSDNFRWGDGGNFVSYLSVICRRKRSEIEKPYIGELYYIRGILKNRISNFDSFQYYVLPLLEELYQEGITLQDMADSAKQCSSWYDFQRIYGR